MQEFNIKYPVSSYIVDPDITFINMLKMITYERILSIYLKLWSMLNDSLWLH